MLLPILSMEGVCGGSLLLSDLVRARATVRVRARVRAKRMDVEGWG